MTIQEYKEKQIELKTENKNNEYCIYYEMALEIVFGKAKTTQVAHQAPSLTNCVVNQR
jgi:hypothetical protein